MSRRRVVITGIEVIAPGGVGREKFWQLLSSGRTATRGITFFDPAPFRSRVAAEADFSPYEHGLTPQEVRRLDRAAQFAVVASRGAVADSGIDLAALEPHRVGVTVGSAVGATMGLDQEYRVVSDGGRLDVLDHTYAVPQLYDYMVPSSFASEVAWAVGAEGPSTVVSTGCTSGIDSVGYAVELVREGSADVVIAGSSDAPISPITMACFDAIKATTPRHDEPECASRPFDKTRNGFVLGEGAAFFVLEELESAKERGAHIYAEIAGYATRSNAYHMTGLRPDGKEMAEAIDLALAEARLNPEAIDYVNAHGSGTKQNDRHETAAFKRSLGDHAYRTPVSSIKSMVGHSLGAIGSIEIAASALAMEYDVVPPTANLHHADPECDLDYVPVVARDQLVDAVLTVGSGFGGFQSAMVLASPERSLV
ncbi:MULTISPECIES: beta-ketoacyl-[acyl-carrier-protein] synthase family protein [Streptomyces]|uniref:Beta-ketoacyl-[acyl-carrier-protein] synthase family protein n=1 Tax=Streptomyces caniscabiei TaxID=2746961 RepID=A0ABU4N3V9_9ACTN|nr:MULTISPECIES: beta-ketoacyl-[acyl-carrier-protein] synthase family protein [Streptomyces]MBE4741631.1 beta-ketoacyl-[acyl-carrier-protein] synthase family protein [Streptomyces caniscabiei]MBE4761947.1 beta-ketoacyl-[acyl-carrier-protein] synthase family protein [Streptomyces caniscabiei]MBE4775279.1 beta-ketoacyl-[acyl-carrier-protein] synthase family protein [Streptomyces caniscabiei]MBE4790407.1 beta-ketoacyl-[acyl-carrier-protein] synthase family protein [Streptomyces caniscabiei]MBE479